MVEPLHFGEQLRLGHRIGKDALGSLEPELARLLRFVAHVDLGGGVVADADRDETRFVGEGGNGGGDFLFDGERDGFAVDDASGHGARLYHVSRWPGMNALTLCVRQCYRFGPFPTGKVCFRL